LKIPVFTKDPRFRFQAKQRLTQRHAFDPQQFAKLSLWRIKQWLKIFLLLKMQKRNWICGLSKGWRLRVENCLQLRTVVKTWLRDKPSFPVFTKDPRFRFQAKQRLTFQRAAIEQGREPSWGFIEKQRTRDYPDAAKPLLEVDKSLVVENFMPFQRSPAGDQI
jgi:hypothetical protein